MTELKTWFAESVGTSSILMKVDTLAKMMTANATKTSALNALSSVKAMYAMKGTNLANNSKNAPDIEITRRPATCA